MIYCINNLKKGQNHAGSKAPADVFEIAKKNGAGEIRFYEPKRFNNLTLRRLGALPVGISNWIRLDRTVKKNDWVILQHPNENIVIANRYIDRLKKRKNIHFVGLIHDLDSIRKSLIHGDDVLSSRNEAADDVLLKKCDLIICHNEKMKEYLVCHGFEENRVVCLEIFDYLHDCRLPEKRVREKSVVVAGNLLRGKCEYLYKLCDMESLPFNFHLFGPNYEGKKSSAFVNYHGVCTPDELPGKLEGSFGLVWDGTEIDRCAGNAGEYIKYNNPHKCSLFLSSNMPVIIWKQAALADFVEKNGVGITVDSLLDIGEAIDRLSDKEYAEMLERTRKMGEKLREGYFLKKAMKAITLNV
jgi:hypothetical protein